MPISRLAYLRFVVAASGFLYPISLSLTLQPTEPETTKIDHVCERTFFSTILSFQSLLSYQNSLP